MVKREEREAQMLSTGKGKEKGKMKKGCFGCSFQWCQCTIMGSLKRTAIVTERRRSGKMLKKALDKR